LNYIQAKLLVDTGATVTLVSLRITERIPQNMRPELMPITSRILTAGGEELKVAGVGEFSFEIGVSMPQKCASGRNQYRRNFGFDFLRDHKGVVDVVQGNLTLDKFTQPLLFEGSFGC